MEQQYIPCKVDFKVNTSQSDDLLRECTNKIGSGTEWNWWNCNLAIPTFNYGDVSMILFYTYLAIQVGILLIYASYKGMQTKSKSGYELLKSCLKGYQTDWFGSFVKYSFILTTLVWFAVVIGLTALYYLGFSGPSKVKATRLFENHSRLAVMFVIVWHFMTLWFMILLVWASDLQRWFLRECSANVAEYILMTKPRENPIRLKDSGLIVRIGQWIEKKAQWITRTEDIKELCKVEQTMAGTKYVTFQCVRYLFNPNSGEFERQSVRIDFDNFKGMTDGLSESDALERIDLLGYNELAFKSESFLQGVVTEFCAPFYLYQLMILLTWYFYAYYYMGIVLTVVIVISGITKVLVASYAQQRILDMIRFTGSVNVLRDGSWKQLDIKNLVPGDIFHLERSSHPLSVDCMIINGDVVVDESSLTGEALPVGKFAWTGEQSFSKDNAKSSLLYAGTVILDIQSSGEKCLAVVTETGAMTERGKLVREILYPVPFIFEFNEHLKVVIPLLLIWGILMLIVSIVMLESQTVDSWFYGMFSISQILSPLLPTVFVIGQSISAERLRASGIMCSDLNRITLAGKVKIFCFDKTGTLTKEGLEFLGAQTVNPETISLEPVDGSFERFPYLVKSLMMTCHSLTTINGSFVGNFVDTEMFKATEALIVPTNNSFVVDINSKPLFKILKRFQFVHSHAYMTVVAQDLETNQQFVFVKGSYEKILEKVTSSTVPSDFTTQALYHASKGCYVIALAYKRIHIDDVNLISRDGLENGLDLLGILLFRNELKEDSPEVLKELKDGNCHTVMITGDHAFTASYIGSQCKILEGLNDKSGFVFIVDYDGKSLIWKELNSNLLWEQSRVEAACKFSKYGGKLVEFLINGAAFRILDRSGWIETNLEYIKIFARMRPLDKIDVVKRYMAENITAMIGDGNNDSGALKIAHVGISLSSSAESSVVSHFSSKGTSLECCLTLLKESRCSLDVSLAAYKMLIMYGEVLMLNNLVQMYFMVQQSQPMWILIDACAVPISVALTLAKPAKKLAYFTPTAKLLGKDVLTSIVGQICINLGYLTLAMYLMYSQPFYRCHEFDSSRIDLRRWWELSDNYEGSLTGLLTGFQIIHAACSFNLGSHFRLGFWKNYVFLIAYSIGLAFMTYVLIADPNPVGCLFRVNCGTKEALMDLGYSVNFSVPPVFHSAFGHNVFPLQFRLIIWGIMFLNLITLVIWESIIQWFSPQWNS